MAWRQKSLDDVPDLIVNAHLYIMGEFPRLLHTEMPSTNFKFGGSPRL